MLSILFSDANILLYFDILIDSLFFLRFLNKKMIQNGLKGIFV